MTDNLADFSKEYEKNIPEKIKQVEELISSLQKEMKEETLHSLQALVHKTAGTAGSFGYMSVTNLCREWDQKLKEAKENLSQGKDLSSLPKELEGFLQKLKENFSRKG